MGKKRVRIKKKVNKERTIKFLIVLFITGYLCSSLIGFITTEKFNYVTASYGSINDQEYTKGIITREEEIILSPVAGFIKYLYIEGVKIPVKHPIVRLGDNSYKDIYSDMIVKANKEIETSQESLGTTRYDSNGYNTNDIIKSRISRYMKSSKSKDDFNDIYRLESQIKGLMKDRYETYIVENNRALEAILSEKQGVQAELNKSYQNIFAEKGGIISYYVDEFTDLTPDQVTLDFIKDYKDLTEHISIESRVVTEKEPLYRIVTSQTWNITFYLDEPWKYKTNDRVKVYIDGQPLYGKVKEANQVNKKHKVVITFDEYIHHFIKERVVTVKVGETNIEGIKLPKSSLIKKSLIGIPEDYVEYSQGVNAIIKRTSDNDLFTKINIIYKRDGFCYISAEGAVAKLGDQLVSSKVNPIYTVINQIELPGVYVINKGYKEFRVVETLTDAKDYVIIAKDTPQGVKLYDRVQTEDQDAVQVKKEK